MNYNIFGAYSHFHPDGVLAPHQISMSIDGHEAHLVKASDEPFLNFDEMEEAVTLHVAVRDLVASRSAQAVLSLHDGKATVESIEDGAFTFDSLSGKGRLYVTIRFERFY